MRSRSRRSSSNYISAAILEIMIMGIFVIIAQPQLRQAFFELLHPADTPSLPVQLAGVPMQLDGYRFGPAEVNAETRLPPLNQSMAMSANSLMQPAMTGVMPRTSHYAPLEQYESFSVPINNSPTSSHFASHNMQSSAAWNSGHGTATQINAGDWNIASAAQSPRPLSGWTAMHSAGTNYLDTYPPPYGTQSQWK